MPKKIVFSKEAIIESAFELFKNNGIDYITARSVAKNLNSSPAPIYKSIGSMSSLKEELIDRAKNLFMSYINVNRTGITFLDIGMGIVIFSREEKKLFSNIFLKENIERALVDEFLELVYEKIKNDERFSKFSDEIRDNLFLNCWIYTHGLSTLVATNFIKNPTDEYIKNKLLENPAKFLYDFLEKK